MEVGVHVPRSDEVVRQFPRSWAPEGSGVNQVYPRHARAAPGPVPRRKTGCLGGRGEVVVGGPLAAVHVWTNTAEAEATPV